MSTVSAPAEPPFLPILTPEAAQIFADTPAASVQIPEVYELLTVAIAMANIEDFLVADFSGDEFMIDKSTPYYGEVEVQFGGFRDHPLVTKIRETYKPMIESLNYIGLLTYRNQSLGYRFSGACNLIPTGLYMPLRDVVLPAFP